MCQICGLPQNIPCSCESQQPFCNQCSDDDACLQIMDSQCVLYHWNSQIPTKLINMGLPNNSSAQTIFERIDQLLGRGYLTLTPSNTPSVDIVITGNTAMVIQAEVNVSTQLGNILEILSSGLYVPDVRDWKVKVNANDYPGYLVDKIVGDTDGIVSVSSVLDSSGHLVKIVPSLNLNALESGFLNPQNTRSIDLSLSNGVAPFVLTANSNISADAGNTISIHSDGLYASGGGGVDTADNGLNITSGPVELGGSLIKNTIIDFGAAYSLSLTNTPVLSIGSSTPSTALGNLQVIKSGTGVANAGYFFNSTPIVNGGGNATTANLQVTGGTQSDTSGYYGSFGQIIFNGTTDSVLTGGSDGIPGYAGIGGIILKYNSGNISGNTISAGHFGGFVADAGNISSMAAIRLFGVNTPPIGSSFSGTITNYYGVLIEDIAGSAQGSHITNKFAIYQTGTSDISRFFGPVQNASSTVQFTSDARVKENIQPFTRGLAEIDNIKTHEFNYTFNKGKTVVGVIAQELEKIIPEAVEQSNFAIPNGESFDDFRFVDQTRLFYTMLNAIKELSEKVKRLESLTAGLTTFS